MDAHSRRRESCLLQESGMTQFKKTSLLPLLGFTLLFVPGAFFGMTEKTGAELLSAALLAASGLCFLLLRFGSIGRTDLPMLYLLGILGGASVSSLRLSYHSTVWTWTCYVLLWLSVTMFTVAYDLSHRIFERRQRATSAQRGKNTASGQKCREKEIVFLRRAIFLLLGISILCFCIEGLRLRYIPLFTSHTPHAYSYFHLPGLHYFTTLFVLVPAVSYLLFRKEGKKITLPVLLGLLLPLTLAVLLVSRFQLIFSVLLLLMTGFAYGFRIRRRQLFLIFLALLSLYVLLTIERAHSVSYLNGIFAMKNRKMPIFITQPYIYISNNYDNLNLLTEHVPALFLNRHNSFGWKELYPFVTLSGLKYFVDLPLSYPVYITKEELTTLTLLYDAYYDFGLYGILLFSLLLGGGTGILHAEMETHQNPFLTLIYAQFSFYLLFSFFTTWFSNPASWFYLGVSGVLAFRYEKRGREGGKAEE